MTDDQPQDGALPRDNLIRATFPANVEVRDDTTDAPVMDVQFARYNEWTEINSAFEGNFMERNASKAFAKTIKENLPNMRSLFNHGKDPQIGDKVLGPIESIKDTETGPRARVPLFDTSYNRDLIPGLKAGVYGASYRFKVLREEFVQTPEKSDYNPKGLPERTITEAKVMEFGPVTFPAYEGASAGVRALTLDDLTGVVVPGSPKEDAEEEQQDEPEAREETTEEKATVVEDAAPSHPPSEVRRDTQPEKAQTEETKMKDYKSVEEIDARLSEIETEQTEIYKEWGVRSFDVETQARWDEMKDEKAELETMKTAFLERKAYIEAQATKPAATERGAASPAVVAKRNAAPENVFDMGEYHTRSTSRDHMSKLLKEGATRAVDNFRYPGVKDQDAANRAVTELLDMETPDQEIEQRMLVHGSPLYRSAFWKTLAKQPLNPDEQRKLSEGMQLEARALTAAADGGVTVPVQIDPTVLLASTGAINPFRQVARIVRTTSYQWQGVTSTGITSQYRLEGTAMTDNAPALLAPTITPERADAFVPFTWEAAQDWGSLEGEMANLFADSKDVLEATKFAVGAGHALNEPLGVLTAAGTVVGSAATTTVGTVDIYALEGALPVRFQPRASWLATPALFSRIRQQAALTTGGIWADNLRPGQPAQLLGYPAYKASTVGTAGNLAVSVASAKWGIFGDFNYFAIVDRIGFQVRPIENLFNGNTAGGIAYPNGMSGLVAYWRNSSGVLTSNAFRVGTVT